MATREQLQARTLMKQLEQQHVLAALKLIDAGEEAGFAESVKYDLLVDGRRYPPKRAVGVALNLLSGKTFDPYAFKGGDASLCFQTLRRLKFDLVPKQPEYDLMNRAQVLAAVEELGSPNRSEIRAYVLARNPKFVVSNITPDLQLLCVNSNSRGHHYHNKQPRRCDTGDLFDVLFQEGSGRDARFTLYDPTKHGVWELARIDGSSVLRPRLVQPASAPAGLLRAIAEAEAQRAFEADSDRDARTKAMRAIALRQGQPKFRQELLAAYDSRCAISGCDVPCALEAAHIVPYRGEHTNAVRNGLVLRADLHTLFDLGLIRIHHETLEVILAPQLAGSSYEQFAGVKMRLPANEALWPDRKALRVQGLKSQAAAT